VGIWLRAIFIGYHTPGLLHRPKPADRGVQLLIEKIDGSKPIKDLISTP
jgi:hypothetical protein